MPVAKPGIRFLVPQRKDGDYHTATWLKTLLNDHRALTLGLHMNLRASRLESGLSRCLIKACQQSRYHFKH
jgi:hypothetical protein